MDKIIDQVTSKIQSEKIKPIPKWKFWLRDGSQWAGLGLFIVLIVVVAGLLLYFWSDGPWVHGGRFGFQMFFGRAPLVLMGLIIILSMLGLFDFYNTKRGYRYPRAVVVPILSVFIFLSGWTVYHFGFSAHMDQSLGNMPFYQNREAYMKDVWSHPEDGLLAGGIISVDSNDVFYLRDFDEKKWKIDASQAVWRHGMSAEQGTQIKLLGKAEGDVFIADEIRPWMGMGGCQTSGKQGTCGMMESERKR